jgi:hypothetical protein
MGQAIKDTLITPDEGRAECGFEEKKGPAAGLLVAGTMKSLEHINDKPPAPVMPGGPKDIEKSLKACGYSEEEIAEMLPEQFGEAA